MYHLNVLWFYYPVLSCWVALLSLRTYKKKERMYVAKHFYERRERHCLSPLTASNYHALLHEPSSELIQSRAEDHFRSLSAVWPPIICPHT